MNDFALQQDTLPSGLRTVLLPRTEGETVTFLVLIGVGSRYETPRQAGLSHFLEHMFFKGTSTRPTTKEIAEAIDAVGGEFNAFTSEEYTGYYVKVATQHLAYAADVVADILLRPLFASEEIERERGVIKEEMRMYTDTPMSHIWHLWNQALFGDHPLGRRIDGLPETVQAFQRKDFLNYTKKHYHTSNAVVTVAGKFNSAKTEELLTKLFAMLPQGKAEIPKKAPRRLPAQRFISETRKSLDQTHIIVGTPGVALADPRRWAIEVLTTVLGGGMSSRLFLSVRERHGLAYSIRSAAEVFTDTGMIATQAGVRSDKAPQALELILNELDRVMQEPVKDDELNKAKQMIRGRMLIGLEESNTLAGYAGTQELLEGNIETPDEVLNHIDAVTAEEIQKIAQELFTDKFRAVALLGPQKSTRAFTKVLGV